MGRCPKVLSYALILVGVILWPDFASACSCVVSPAPCGSLGSGSIFVGTVKSKSGATLDGAGDRGPTYTFEIEVVESLVGVSSPTVTVRTATDTAACGYPFQVGKSYLVYAGAVSNGVYSVSFCSRTRPLADANDDLALIRAAVQGHTSSRVFGRVLRQGLQVNGSFFDTRPMGPVPGVTVVARSGAYSVETTTDADGRFVFLDLPLGQYDIEPRLPPGMKSMFPREPVSVGRCGAADVVFLAITDAPLRGILRRPDGSRVGSQVGVTVIRVDADATAATAVERSTIAFTNDQGRFEFDGLPPGRYVIGVNVFDPPSAIAPYPRTFHPSSSTLSGATPIDIQDGEPVSVDFRLPPALPMKRLSGVVIDEREAPVPGASLTIADAEFPHSLEKSYVTSDEEGRFDVSVIAGREYLVTVVSHAAKRQAEFKLGAGDGGPLRVVIRP